MNLINEIFHLRPIEVADLERFRFWSKDLDFDYPCSNLNWPLRSEEFGILLSPNDSFRLFAVIDQKIVGFAGYLSIDWKNRCASLTWGVEKNSNLVSKLIEELVNFAFKELNLQRVETEIRENQNETAEILSNLGFKLEGVKRESFYYQNRYFNTMVWAKLADF